jgi:AcrR family transcriptional regulator
MPRKPDPTLRPAIIDKVTAHLRDTPLEDVSVRSLGRVLGTSAYPIVYHFGSRDALIDAVVEHLAGSTDATELDPDGDANTLADHLVTVYGRLDDPDRALAARLAFELGSVESLADRSRHRAMHRRQVDSLTAWCVLHGAGEHDSARIALAAVLDARGVQWGWLVDPDSVDVEPALRTIAARVVDAVERVADALPVV